MTWNGNYSKIFFRKLKKSPKGLASRPIARNASHTIPLRLKYSAIYFNYWVSMVRFASRKALGIKEFSDELCSSHAESMDKSKICDG